MSEDYLPILFDSFSHERNTTTENVVGTGLGMSIVKGLDLMGGSIEVESELGKGTTFTVILEHRIADEVYFKQKKNEMPAATYNVILMDIQMPNMDGYKATQAIRRLPNKAKADIPIIAITANAFEEDKKKALEMGMNGHIAKPISIENIKKTLAPVS